MKWVLLIGLLASFSYGNGLLVWVIGILVSLIQANYKRLFLYFGVLATLLLFYFFQETPADSSHGIDAKFLVDIVLYFIQIHAYFINWPGYALPWAPLVIGAGIIALFGYVLIKSKLLDPKSEKSYLLFYLLFLSLSMALISLARASVDGLTANVVDHYKIYSCLFLGCLVYYTTEQLKLSTRWSYSFWLLVYS
ncbi:hypothetical protein GO730_24735 [Spirosoma sp. HMF3257]|uniref:hypothetical protein n=1 Tax=Spirosoma telluris TaxID=2183553 RepID=UPI0011B94650|nr:hypothetical protein [Spirosoma telluris]